jgi:hypothetical protein
MKLIINYKDGEFVEEMLIGIINNLKNCGSTEMGTHSIIDAKIQKDNILNAEDVITEYQKLISPFSELLLKEKLLVRKTIGKSLGLVDPEEYKAELVRCLTKC